MDRETLNDLAWTVSEKYEEAETRRFAEFGLCGRCKDFKWRKTKLMMEMEVWCDSYKQNERKKITVEPNSSDPVVDCSDFYPKGQMSLESMSKIATFIDVNERRVGFKQVIDKEVIISKPGNDKK